MKNENELWKLLSFSKMQSLCGNHGDCRTDLAGEGVLPENGGPAVRVSERESEGKRCESGKAAKYVEKLCLIWSENGNVCLSL